MIVQRFHHRNAIYDMELVLNPRLFYLLVSVAKSTNEIVCHLYRPITCILNSFFHGTPMLYFFMELKCVWIGRTTTNPFSVLFINMGLDTTMSNVGDSLFSKSNLSYPNTKSPCPYVSKNTQYSELANGSGNSIFLKNTFVP